MSLDSALADIADRIGSREVAVGFLEGATYPEDGTPVAAVAFWNEYGDSKRPARPFFRMMIAKESETWAPKIAMLLKSGSENVLAVMGEDIQGALKQSINDLQSPPLAPSTIARKGFAKPLIDTSHMLNSIGYELT